MKKLILAFVFCVAAYYSTQAQNNIEKTNIGAIKTASVQTSDFTLGQNEFLLNGKPFLIRAGELHFPRIPRAYWDHRIKMLKAMGMNTVCIYLFWNLHEERMDSFDFSGQKDVAEFVRLIQANGMYCIVRPGPYACAEWDMGGLPWWLLKKKDVKVRSKDDPFFMERSGKYLKEVGKQLSSLQIQKGGSIIMVQVENEYGAFGKDGDYMEATRKNVLAAGFDRVQLMRCDWSSNFNNYQTAPSVAVTLNFGAGSDIDKQFELFKKLYPSAPLMCSEYWTGWFDNWGRPHETRSINSFIGSLKDMMERRISFSLYMAHGGTTFGQWGGANAPPYSPMVTSYDYDAPIDEQGRPTDKFFAVRDLLKNYLNPGEKIGVMPTALEVIEIPKITFIKSANLFENLPPAQKSKSIMPMEMFDQGWGRINYRTNLTASTVPRKLVITDVHDWASIFINGKLVGNIDRRRAENTVQIPPVSRDAVLDILVETTGRVNFGEAIIDRKGITQKVEIFEGDRSEELTEWSCYSFPVDYDFQSKMIFKNEHATGPAWHKANFKLSKTGDTYLDLSTWSKGMVWVNGHNIGRFWKIGPQQTMFVPGVWLKKGINEIIVLDLEVPIQSTMMGLKRPVVDKIVPDASLLVRKNGQKLDLSSVIPVLKGKFDDQKNWKDIMLKNITIGRYFCLEATTSQLDKDMTSAIAELQVMDAENHMISTQKWKVIYADSEEMTAANHAADRIYDNQESTFWQSQYIGGTVPHPHQVVIDLGAEYQIKGFRYLPRSDKNKSGMIKDYNIYISVSPFKM
ncbi:beta-galactosidase [Pedobacter sp. BMA]|uniref:beta-galactosidase n=1 Tax=Pedobacter sp. BMA TaxID=1663685 RepID=UPI00069EC00E|nr:beta-galactosidase [Pedobacter sp. BMA]